ncbi:8003_t:CDS:2, partial [Scutellospora calospora]
EYSELNFLHTYKNNSSIDLQTTPTFSEPTFDHLDTSHLKLHIEQSTLLELSDSSENSSDNNVNSYDSHRYLFNLYVNDSFDTFEEARKKLDRYLIEHKFAIRKGRMRTRKDGTHCNFSMGNKAITICCSLLNDDSIHNYPIDDNIKSNAPKYYRLSNKMLNKVELYYQYHIQPIEPVIGDMDSELKGIFWQSNEQVQLLTRFGDLFTCLKKGNPEYEPGVIFSDFDPAITAAIAKTFTTTYYYLCQKKELLKADNASSQDQENIIQVINLKVIPVKG